MADTERYRILRGTVLIEGTSHGPGDTVELPPGFAAPMLVGPTPFLARAVAAPDQIPSVTAEEHANPDGELTAGGDAGQPLEDVQPALGEKQKRKKGDA